MPISQEQETYDIMVEICPARSSQIVIECLRYKIGAGSSLRYVRWMRDRGIVKSYKKDGDKEMTFEVIAPYLPKGKPPPEDLFNIQRYSWDR